MISIIESEMTFGPFDEESFFHIESSEVYIGIAEHVKMVEFITYKQQPDGIPQIMFVEAKQSSPHPDNLNDWNTYITDLKEKFENGLNLFLALSIKRYNDPAFPEIMQNIDLSTNQFLITLVIKGHRPEWLAPLKYALNEKLRPLQKTLNLGPNPVMVLNDQLALQIGLIGEL